MKSVQADYILVFTSSSTYTYTQLGLLVVSCRMTNCWMTIRQSSPASLMDPEMMYGWFSQVMQCLNHTLLLKIANNWEKRKKIMFRNLSTKSSLKAFTDTSLRQQVNLARDGENVLQKVPIWWTCSCQNTRFHRLLR